MLLATLVALTAVGSFLATAMRFSSPPTKWNNTQTAKSLHAIEEINHFLNLTKMVINIDTMR